MITIRESFSKYLHSEQNNLGFSLLINPTIDEIKEIKEEEFSKLRVREQFYLRALLVDKTKLYVWCGDMSIHYVIMKELNLVKDKDVIPLALQLTQECKIESMSYSPEIRETIYDNEEYSPASMEGEQYYNSKLQPILKACQAIKNIAAPNIDWELVNDY